MQIQSSNTKQNSERYLQLIRQQFKLLQKQKPPHKLIHLIQSYELNPQCQLLNKQLIHYLIIGYLLNHQYLDLRHLVKRYQLSKSYGGLEQLVELGLDEDLQKYCGLFDQNDIRVINRIKQKGKQIVLLNNFDQLMQKSKLSYILKTLSKYYLNISLNQFNKISNNQNRIKNQDIQSLGYQIKDGYIELKQEQQQVYSPQIQQTLLRKMKELAIIAESIQSNH